jgi:hypothetical protein
MKRHSGNEQRQRRVSKGKNKCSKVRVGKSAHARITYAPLAILAARSIALRFCRGTMVGACKLAGRALGGVAMAPLTSDNRESERRGELTSPCADAGRPSELVDRDRDGPIGALTTICNLF